MAETRLRGAADKGIKTKTHITERMKLIKPQISKGSRSLLLFFFPCRFSAQFRSYNLVRLIKHLKENNIKMSEKITVYVPEKSN